MNALPPGSFSFAPRQTLRLIRHPDSYFREGFARHGDPFCARLLGDDVVVTSDPEGVREVFSADPDTFESQGSALLQPLLGSNSLLLIAGERHKRERRLLMPPLHGERMRAYGTLMQRIAREQLAGLAPGAKREAGAMARAISLEVIIRAVFGVEDPEQVQRYERLLVEYQDAYVPLLAVVPALRRPFGGLGPWAHFQRKAQELDTLLDAQLRERRAAGSAGMDVLSLLLAARDEAGQPMTDTEIKDELRTMLFAGHETTAIGMTWALYYLHRLPAVRARLEAELRALGPSPTPEALAQLPYLGAVCDEALRIHPVVHIVGRRLRRPFTLRGHTLPAGMGVVVAIVQAHANPEVYPEPEQFRPERFLERRFTPFEYMPFGGGARRCIGAAFALYEMRMVLGTLLAEHRFSLTHEAPVRPARRQVTMGPDGPVELRYLGPAAV